MDEQIEFTHDTDRVDVDAVWRLLRETYWSPAIRRDVVERAMRHSIIVAALERNATTPGRHRVIGFGRVVTDRATFAWICDVVVVEDRRGRGIARTMVRRLMAHPELTTLRRFCLATRDAHGVYTPLGFEPVQPGRWLERRLDPSGWQERSTG